MRLRSKHWPHLTGALALIMYAGTFAPSHAQTTGLPPVTYNWAGSGPGAAAFMSSVRPAVTTTTIPRGPSITVIRFPTMNFSAPYRSRTTSRK